MEKRAFLLFLKLKYMMITKLNKIFSTLQKRDITYSIKCNIDYSIYIILKVENKNDIYKIELNDNNITYKCEHMDIEFIQYFKDFKDFINNYLKEYYD